MKGKNTAVVVVALAMAIGVAMVQAQTTTTHLVGAAEAKKMIDEGKFDLVVDVRTMEEYMGPMGHIKGAKLLPIQSLETGMKAIEAYKNKTVLVYCHSGGRSAKSARILQSNGFTNVFDLEGGITGWKSQGFETDNKPSMN